MVLKREGSRFSYKLTLPQHYVCLYLVGLLGERNRMLNLYYCHYHIPHAEERSENIFYLGIIFSFVSFLLGCFCENELLKKFLNQTTLRFRPSGTSFVILTQHWTQTAMSSSLTMSTTIECSLEYLKFASTINFCISTMEALQDF